MIIDYQHGYAFSKRFSVLDAKTGENLDPIGYYYADDRVGLIRRYRPYPDPPGAGPRRYCTGPEGEAIQEEIRRPIKIVVADHVTDPGERDLAEQFLATHKDHVSESWPDERLNEVEGMMIGVVEDAIGRGDIGMEAIDEVRAMLLRFRRMREELDAVALARREQTNRAARERREEREALQNTRPERKWWPW